MKKHYAFILFAIVFFSADAQTNVYHPFPDSNAVWTVLFEYQSSPSNYSQQLQNYFMKGDTTINNKLYHKIYNGNGYSGAIRQDITTKSVYFHGYYQSSFANDTLLYTFGLHVGDTVPIKFASAVYPEKIISIDSILINGNYRKRFNTNGSINNNAWIEGVGSTHFLFMPFDY